MTQRSCWVKWLEHSGLILIELFLACFSLSGCLTAPNPPAGRAVAQSSGVPVYNFPEDLSLKDSPNSRVFGEWIEENKFFQDLTDQTEHRIMHPAMNPLVWVDMTFFALAETSLFAPFALLDFELPNYTATHMSYSMATRNAKNIASPLYGIGFRKGRYIRCLEQAYIGNRERALELASQLVASGSQEFPENYFTPMLAYLYLGEPAKARQALAEYNKVMNKFSIATPTDILVWMPVSFGIAAVMGAQEPYFLGRNMEQLAFFMRLVHDQGYIEFFDEQSFADIEQALKVMRFQEKMDLGPWKAIVLGRAGKYAEAQKLIDAGIAAYEMKLKQHQDLDILNHQMVNYGPLVSACFLPGPLGNQMMLTQGMEFSRYQIYVPDRHMLAILYREKIRTLCVAKRSREALGFLEKLDAATKFRPWNRWIYLDGAFQIALSEGNLKQALEFDRQFIGDAIGKAQFHRLQVYAFEHGQLLEQAGAAGSALQCYLGVVNALDSLYQKIEFDVVRSEDFNRQYMPFYQRVIALMVQTGSPAREILIMSERTKNRILAASIMGQRSRMNDIDPAYREDYQRLAASYRSQKIQAAVLADPEARAKAEKSLDSLRGQLRMVETLSREKGMARTGQFVRFATSGDFACPPDIDTMLVYWLGDPFSLCFECDRANKVTMRRLPPRQEIAQWVGQYRTALTNPASDVFASEAGRRLAELLAPRTAPSSRILVIPDKELNLLPFEALPLAGGNFWLERHETAYALSLALMNKGLSTPQEVASNKLLAVGDPAFASSSKGDAGTIARAYRDHGIEIARLPGTREEVRMLSRLFSETTMLVDTQARESAIRQAQPDQYRFLHFATHGLLGEEAIGPGEPSLALAPPTAQERRNGCDAFLSASEIAGLTLNADLVTLSACNTAVGRISSGDGLQSLASAFFGAGARRVVVSTWSVNDASTSQLMNRFYQNLASKEDPFQALRKAKLDLLHQGGAGRADVRRVGVTASAAPAANFTHPFYWAAMICIGVN